MLASGEVHTVTMSDVVPGVATTPRGAAWACVRYQETTVVLVCVPTFREAASTTS